MIGAVGRIEPQKAPETLLQVTAPLLRENLPVQIVWIGDGAGRHALEALAIDLGVPLRVDGWRDDASRRMAGFDVFALPSRFEGLPLALLEAMHAALPVVASPVDGIPEAVVPNRTGYLPRSDRDWVDCLRRLAVDPDLRLRLGLGGQAAAEARFSVETMARKRWRSIARWHRCRPDMPTVIHVIPYMAAAAGGPPVVVDRLAGLSGQLGWSARVVTTPALATDGGLALRTAAQGRYEVTVLPSQRAAWAGSASRQLEAALRSADILHLHTLWSPLVARAAALARRRGLPYVLSPHGMLDPWSLSKKRLRKRLYMALVERRVIEGASAILFTTEPERDLAQASGLSLPRPMVVPLGADPMPGERPMLAQRFFARHPRLAGRRIVLFLGRLHPKKRPELAIEALARLGRAYEDVHLVLAGAGEADYLARLDRLARAGGVRDRVHRTGHLDGLDKWSALAAADLFVLPSQQENFGIAVAEAMQAGLPVVLSRGVNLWPEVVSAARASRLMNTMKRRRWRRAARSPRRSRKIGNNGTEGEGTCPGTVRLEGVCSCHVGRLRTDKSDPPGLSMNTAPPPAPWKRACGGGPSVTSNITENSPPPRASTKFHHSPPFPAQRKRAEAPWRVSLTLC